MPESGNLYAGIATVDTSAAIALRDPADSFHDAAKAFFESKHGLAWSAVNVTAHEAYTRGRYNVGYEFAVAQFNFLAGRGIRRLAFQAEDEMRARALLEKHRGRSLSFHDALTAAVMLRIGIYKIFTFDVDFLTFGFELLPGTKV